MAALQVTLACTHYLWPTGSPSMWTVGETAYCGTCRKQQEITEVGRAEW
jgi:hypothetical protein